MSHPETSQLPAVQQPKSEVESKPEVQKPTSSNRKIIPPKSEDYSSDQKKKPPKPEEKPSKPEVSGRKKKLVFNGAGGRIHTEAQIDRILDEYILTGKLPSYLTNSKQGTRLVEHLPLPELKQTSLSFQEQELTVADCEPEVFKAFVSQYTEVENVKPEQWNDIYMRWRLINFLIDNGVLEVENGKLVELPEVELVAQEGA